MAPSSHTLGVSRKAGVIHSTASLTMDIYAHAIAANDRDTADTIGGVIFGKSEND